MSRVPVRAGESLLQHPRLARVATAFLRDPGQAFPLLAAARLAGLEPHYFSTVFHEFVGMRFSAWVRLVRVTAAQELLRTTMRITDVALAVGYNDLRTFERAFKRQTGTTPTLFRAIVR